MKGIFGGGEPRQDRGQSSQESLIEKATRLCHDLRSDLSKVYSRHSKSSRKRKREKISLKEYQKNLVLVDFPGPDPNDVMSLREYDKVFDGALCFSSFMDEDDIRDEIIKILRQKSSITHDLSRIQADDFTFVKCANRKVRVPDGGGPFDSKRICRTYSHGAIYVRLNKDMSKTKVGEVYS